MARQSPSGNWQVWPVGKAATENLKMITSKGRVATFGRIMVKRERPQWQGRELWAWLVGTEIRIKFRG